MKHILSLAAVAVLAAGCGLKTATYTDDQAMPLAEGRSDSLILSVSLQYPRGGAPKEAVARMTGSILASAFDLEEEPGNVRETALRYEENLKDEYFNENEQMPCPATWEDHVNGYFSGRYKNDYSYIIEYFSFRGGVHGINTLTALVFDGKTGETIPEDVFFNDGYRTPVGELIQGYLPAALEDDEDALQAIFTPDLVGPNGNYEVTASGVTWYFQPYEIGPYYLGLIPVSVPWEDLLPYVR